MGGELVLGGTVVAGSTGGLTGFYNDLAKYLKYSGDDGGNSGNHIKDGLGNIYGKSYKVTEKGVNTIKDHLSSNGMESPENTAMIRRLENALKNGDRITGADASFYLHETREATLMKSGMGYDAAHQSALEFYNVSQYSVYHPDVIKTYSEYFNMNWFNFWGIK